MSDLIKRSDVIQILDENGWLYETNIEDLIKEIPTAFDIDGIIEKLEEKENEAILKAPNTSDITNPEYQKWMMKSYGFKEAIEIVKRGGVDDDVCERKKVKNSNSYKCNTHAEIYDSRVLDWCICPYCLKKIKVVE